MDSDTPLRNLSAGAEAEFGVAEHQSCRHFRPPEIIWEQVCYFRRSWVRPTLPSVFLTLTDCYQSYRNLLFRRGQQLVDPEVSQGTHQVRRPFRQLAPEQCVVGAGSTHMKARILSVHVTDVDKRSVSFPRSCSYDKLTVVLCRPTTTFWDEKLPFGTLCGEFTRPAGVRCIQFLSPHLKTISLSQASPFYFLPCAPC